MRSDILNDNSQVSNLDNKIKVLTSNANYLGPGKAIGPSGERVTREINLKGSFEKDKGAPRGPRCARPSRHPAI